MHYVKISKIQSVLLLSVLLFIGCCNVCLADELEGVPSDALATTGEDVVLDPETTQSVQTLIVNQLVLPAEEEEDEVEIYTLGSQESLENLPNKNVLIYKGTFNNHSCYLIFPAQYEQSLFVTEGGVLVNVSASNVVGRIFYDDSFSVTNYSYTTFTLYSVLSTNTPNQVYRYGYPSYAAYYSVGTGNNLTSTNTYGSFYVTEQIDTDRSSLQFEMYMLLIALVIIQGAMMIFSWMRVAKN